jgi:hypothetical protein
MKHSTGPQIHLLHTNRAVVRPYGVTLSTGFLGTGLLLIQNSTPLAPGVRHRTVFP